MDAAIFAPVRWCTARPVQRANSQEQPMMQQLKRLFQEPMPLRYHALRFVDRWFDFLKYPSKLDYHTIERPWYGHPLLQAAQLAHTLGHANISAIEFGVAGGNGLL
jgi:hypothetical protein